MVTVRIVTRNGGTFTRADNTLREMVSFDYTRAMRQLGIRRDIPLLILDEWTWLKHLKLPKQSIAHYDEGDQIFLRRHAIGKEIGHAILLIELLKHELIHAKLKGKEKINEHGKEFRKLAKKYGVII